LVGVKQVSGNREGWAGVIAAIPSSLHETLFNPVNIVLVALFGLLVLKIRWQQVLLGLAAWALLYAILELIGKLIRRIRRRG
jgi:hypothetical protein